MLWLNNVDSGATEFWNTNAGDAGQDYVNLRTLSKEASVKSSCTQSASGDCAGRINAKASYLKLHRLHGQYDDIAIAVACPAASNGSLYYPDTEGSNSDVHNAIWYTTLRKKAMSNSIMEINIYIYNLSNELYQCSERHRSGISSSLSVWILDRLRCFHKRYFLSCKGRTQLYSPAC